MDNNGFISTIINKDESESVVSISDEGITIKAESITFGNLQIDNLSNVK